MGTPSDTDFTLTMPTEDPFKVDPEFTIDPSVAKAFIEAQKALRGVEKGTDAQYGKFRGMEDIMKALRGLNQEDSNGILDHDIFPFSYWHEVNGKQYHSMRMLHSSGATGMASTIVIPEEHSLRGGNNMQGLKSDGSYSLRIHLESMFLFFQEDNDGYEKPKTGKKPGQLESEETNESLPKKAKEKDQTLYRLKLMDQVTLKETLPQIEAWVRNNQIALNDLEKDFPEIYKDVWDHVQKTKQDIMEGKK